MKLRIDDVRFPPSEAWDDSITEYIKSGKYEAALKQLLFRLIMQEVKEISFDHDLGEDCPYNGYDLLKITLEYYRVLKKETPVIKIHSANPVGVENMENLIEMYSQMQQ